MNATNQTTSSRGERFSRNGAITMLGMSNVLLRISRTDAGVPRPAERKAALYPPAMTIRLVFPVFATIALLVCAHPTAAETRATIEVGSRRELFVDDVLIERLTGQAQLRLHHPEPKEIAIVDDAPWEGNARYHSIFHDGTKYRMYYRAWHHARTPLLGPDRELRKKLNAKRNPEFCCYAESDDGIHWHKPVLELHEFDGSKANNIVITSGQLGTVNLNPQGVAIFKDENPAAPPDATFKAIVRSHSPMGLLVLKSADGLRWTPMTDAPVITDGAFDSQNLAFWDGERGLYRAYWRYFPAGVTDEKNWKPSGDRSIRTATSRDLVHWENQQDLRYVDSPSEHMYTNQVKPYHRAPHLLIGFPTRYIDRGWSESMRALPELKHREGRAKENVRYGTALTESLFMVSRDGVTFKRWNEAFLRPGIERDGTWNYGQQYLAWHVVETKSALDGAPPELSLYATENYWTGRCTALRRYTLRLDGFVSVQAPMAGGELVTKPLRFTGRRLALNFATSAAGSVQVEIQDADGRPFPGFALADCPPLFGDTIERRVTWTHGSDTSTLADRPVRLRLVLQDADVYAFRFMP